jgi:hypothetical protein
LAREVAGVPNELPENGATPGQPNAPAFEQMLDEIENMTDEEVERLLAEQED